MVVVSQRDVQMLTYKVRALVQFLLNSGFVLVSRSQTALQKKKKRSGYARLGLYLDVLPLYTTLIKRPHIKFTVHCVGESFAS